MTADGLAEGSSEAAVIADLTLGTGDARQDGRWPPIRRPTCSGSSVSTRAASTAWSSSAKPAASSAVFLGSPGASEPSWAGSRSTRGRSDRGGNRTGRPQLAPEWRKRSTFSIRFTAEEREAIEAAASAEGFRSASE